MKEFFKTMAAGVFGLSLIAAVMALVVTGLFYVPYLIGAIALAFIVFVLGLAIRGE